jgi:Protein of unknown function (DUF3562)
VYASLLLTLAGAPAANGGIADVQCNSWSETERARMASVDATARKTGAAPDIVKALYAEETARLDAQARLKQFIPLLAIGRVKDRLRELNQRHR